MADNYEQYTYRRNTIYIFFKLYSVPLTKIMVFIIQQIKLMIDIRLRQFGPSHPSIHPPLHCPVTVLQSNDVSQKALHFWRHPMPQYPNSHAASNTVIKHYHMTCKENKWYYSWFFIHTLRIVLTYITKVPLKTSSTPGQACSIDVRTLIQITALSACFLTVFPIPACVTIYRDIHV